MKPITINMIDDSLQRRLVMRKLLKQRVKIEDELLSSNDEFLKVRLRLELKDVDDELDKIPRAELRDLLNKRQSYFRAGSIGLKKAIEQRITFLIPEVEEFSYNSPEEEVTYVNSLIQKCENQLLNKYFRQMLKQRVKEFKIPNFILKTDIDKVVLRNDSRFRYAIHKKEDKSYSEFLNKNKIAGSPRAGWILKLIEIAEEMGLKKGKTVTKEERNEILIILKKDNARNTQGNKITLDDIKRKLTEYGYSNPQKNRKREPDFEDKIYSTPKSKNRPPHD